MVVAILLLLTAVIIDVVRPDLLAALILVPSWCWFLGGMSSAILVWRTGQRCPAIALVILWSVFALEWLEEVKAFARVIVVQIRFYPVPAGRRFRIVSLNCANSVRCSAELKRANPDVVLVQEIPSPDALAQMASQVFGTEGRILVGGDTAIMARSEIRTQFVDPGKHFVIGTVLFDGGREVNCVSLRLIPPVSRLDFWNAEFWLDHRDMRLSHRRQLQQVMAEIGDANSPSPLVIGGDFNTVPLDSAFDSLQPRLSDSFAKAGVGWGATGTNDMLLFRVDQIWTNAHLTPIQVFAEKTTHSDHRMVVCDVVLQ